ncbi:OLC1v1000824C1 [Oldenlandia corymbosa var. corymbosa]|uniref:Bidirectional sugar transporter SWEET n=1 Tax=Oldenlandia corymbosa var. corymbosa TaxID=529605 RepID=A0AAV1D650_OLDCO|nr:OLC1v1000824C1 [Oldenlandia corymbosa var. corymbosa]
MVSSNTARTVVGTIGNIIGFMLFLSPVPTFKKIWEKKSVEQYSAAPYIATLANCSLWVVYGLPAIHPNSTLVMTINGTGIVIEVIYLALFITFCKSNKTRAKLAAIVGLGLVFVVVLAVLVLTLAHTPKLRSTVVGSFGMAGNIMMFAAPLSVTKTVITTKSVEYMPFLLSLASFFNAVSWTAYAFIQFDIYIFVPNSAGTLLGLAQLLLYAIFYKSTQRQLAERKTKAAEVSFVQQNKFEEPKVASHIVISSTSSPPPPDSQEV